MLRKGFRFFPVVCVLLLLSGIFSPAQAEIPCDHQWILQGREPATCTEPGQDLYKCGLCGAENAVPVPPLGHEWDVCTRVKEATCTEEGLIRCFCSRDKTHYEDKTLPALGHNWGEWVVIQKPTLSKPGWEECKCSRCGEARYREIPGRLQRPEYALARTASAAPECPGCLTPEQLSAKDGTVLTFECALVNTGKKDLWIRSYSLNAGNEMQQLEEALSIPSGALGVLRISRAAGETDIVPDPSSPASPGLIKSEIRFFGETEKGDPACVSGPVVLSCPVLPEAEEPLPVQVAQSVLSEPTSPAGYQVGETLRYSVSVTNQGGKVLESLLLAENEAGEAQTIDLQPGETRVLEVEYQVTLQDAVNGYVCRIQSLRKNGKEAAAPSVFSGLLVVPVTAE